MEPNRILCPSCKGRLEAHGQDYHCPACGLFRVDEQGNFRPVDGSVSEPPGPDEPDVPQVDGPAEIGSIPEDGPDAERREPATRTEPVASPPETVGKPDAEKREVRKSRRFRIDIQIGDGDE